MNQRTFFMSIGMKSSKPFAWNVGYLRTERFSLACLYSFYVSEKKSTRSQRARKTRHPIIHWPPPQTSSVKAERLRKQKQNGGGRGRRVRNSPSRAYSYLCTTRYPLPRLSDRIRPLELPVEKAYLQQLYMVTLSAQLLLTHILFLVWISQKLLANENRDWELFSLTFYQNITYWISLYIRKYKSISKINAPWNWRSSLRGYAFKRQVWKSQCYPAC